MKHGCGKQTGVIGTNAGTMPCGAMLTMAGQTYPYYCYECDLKHARAKLIAAAPDLLDALQAAKTELDAYYNGDYVGRPVAQQVAAALAKALGGQ